MEGGDDDDGKKGKNYYDVLGLSKSCTAVELRNAYKKLALRWHPDRCSASGNLKFVEEAKKKFQNIQEAYSVLSDDNKRFLYNVGVYDDDDDENGMGDFLNEMVAMMSQTTPVENGNTGFKDLQALFEEMFQGDINSFDCSSSNVNANRANCATSITTTAAAAPNTATYMSYYDSSDNHKRNITEMNCGNNIGTGSLNGFGTRTTHFQSFCLGTGGASGPRDGESKRRSSVRNSRSRR